MKHKKKQRPATPNLYAGGGDLRCPEHDVSLVWQDSELWWRCPRPHCLHKITLANISATLEEVLGIQAKAREFPDAPA